MTRPRTLLGEICALLALSLAAALLANTLRGESGLQLGRDHFPADSRPSRETPDPGPAGGTQEPAPKASLQHSFTSFSLEDAQAYQPYAASDEGVVFLDARSAKLYRAGHIPGARLCHHYQQDRYLPDLLETLRGADIVVIYCAGGDCEDSIQLATDLVYQHELPPEQLAIYEGGYAEWLAAGLEIREGEQP